ncbi:mandelate racemase/muconate lactonizing enzyme family protein [Pararhodonellum marinum]|uniref:mandelate racemase/muconate lactonizing enzyme family protein n=1 Tax=Pararhodonellum marinum TaxID=2755358 RepID=UPI00188DF862|nr:mandelate racemase/muconate lactonizing enzyme family protein [Pararhodonellum marinum]
MKRRKFIHHVAGITLASSLIPQSMQATQGRPDVQDSPHYPAPILDLHQWLKSPVIIDQIEIKEAVGQQFILIRSKEGVQGITVLNFRMAYFLPVLQDLLQPFFMGRDARDIETILDEIAHARVVYKYSGIPLFNPLGHIEIAIMDLLGKTAGLPASTFFGKRIRHEIPMYVSSLTRETSPEEEVANLQKQLSETGAKAIKIKVGGRMSKNADAAPGRSEQLIPLIRKILGEELTVYADANSSFDQEEGIKMAKFLEEHGVAIFEEPCYWEDYASNRKVAETLTTMKLAGGEQDTSYLRWRDIAETGVYHVLQPDLYYNGGLLRAFYVEKLAKAHGRTMAPHSPKDDPLAAPFFQFASVSPLLEGFQEFLGGKKQYPDWYFPHFDIFNGQIKVPEGPGLGLEYDMGIFK